MRYCALALALGLSSAAANAQSIPAYEKVALDANVLFDSERWSLRPASRDALDDFVLRMHGLESQTVRVVGFADRAGSEASNQILAEERASAVKAYLVMKGIAADRVRTSASLRPDRRVLVEVSGTRMTR
jgi:outer membrane protein OmpA-like peptidoglycan-associated protein